MISDETLEHFRHYITQRSNDRQMRDCLSRAINYSKCDKCYDRFKCWTLGKEAPKREQAKALWAMGGPFSMINEVID